MYQLIGKEHFNETKWSIKITANLGYLCDIASQLFPYNGDIRYIFLFAAFKLHPSGPLGTLLHEIVQAVDMMTNSRRSTSTMCLQATLRSLRKMYMYVCRVTIAMRAPC